MNGKTGKRISRNSAASKKSNAASRINRLFFALAAEANRVESRLNAVAEHPAGKNGGGFSCENISLVEIAFAIAVVCQLADDLPECAVAFDGSADHGEVARRKLVALQRDLPGDGSRIGRAHAGKQEYATRERDEQRKVLIAGSVAHFWKDEITDQFPFRNENHATASGKINWCKIIRNVCQVCKIKQENRLSSPEYKVCCM